MSTEQIIEAQIWLEINSKDYAAAREAKDYNLMRSILRGYLGAKPEEDSKHVHDDFCLNYGKCSE